MWPKVAILNGDGSGGPKYTIPDEVARSRSSPSALPRNLEHGEDPSASRLEGGDLQFFLCFVPTTHLDFTGLHTLYLAGVVGRGSMPWLSSPKDAEARSRLQSPRAGQDRRSRPCISKRDVTREPDNPSLNKELKSSTPAARAPYPKSPNSSGLLFKRLWRTLFLRPKGLFPLLPLGMPDSR